MDIENNNNNVPDLSEFFEFSLDDNLDEAVSLNSIDL